MSGHEQLNAAEPRRVSSLQLLTLPFAFSQDQLLRSDKFISTAKEWAEPVTLDELSAWHRLGIFLPTFRVDDESLPELRVEVPLDDESPEARWGRSGNLRDPAEEGIDERERYARADDDPAGWWNGYLFSKWQIFDISAARWRAVRHEQGDDLLALRAEALEARRRAIALSALTTRHLPSIIGQVSFSGRTTDRLERSRFEVTEIERLRAAGYPPDALRREAEQYLGQARTRDPMKDWWPLLRHSNHSGWSKLEGQVRYAVELRIAAEIMLRAHEALADDGVLEPLPDPDPANHMWQAIYDRIGALPIVADSLDRALGSLGLSPHPKVVLVLEGQTEHVHARRLLEELSMIRPDRVRIQVVGTSSTRPSSLAQYAATPRVGPVRWGVRLLDAPPTAVFIAMDPEGPWATEAKRQRERREIQSKIREEVEAQGGEISRDELDNLVHVFSWGDQKYEFANFTDKELLDGLLALAEEQEPGLVRDTEWRQTVVEALRRARRRKSDIEGVFARARLKTQKPRLAELLMPALVEKFEDAAYGSGETNVPMVEMAFEIRSIVQQFSAGNYSFEVRATE